MEGITLRTLRDLSDAEISAAIRVFAEARNRYSREGRTGLARFFNELALSLKAEEYDRKHLLRNMERQLTPGNLTWGYDDAPDN